MRAVSGNRQMGGTEGWGQVWRGPEEKNFLRRLLGGSCHRKCTNLISGHTAVAVHKQKARFGNVRFSITTVKLLSFIVLYFLLSTKDCYLFGNCCLVTENQSCIRNIVPKTMNKPGSSDQLRSLPDWCIRTNIDQRKKKVWWPVSRGMTQFQETKTRHHAVPPISPHWKRNGEVFDLPCWNQFLVKIEEGLLVRSLSPKNEI